MKRFLCALALVAMTACTGVTVPPPPSPQPSPTATPVASCASALKARAHAKHILRPRRAGVAKTTDNLKYNGGPILDNPKIYLVLWGMPATDPEAQVFVKLFSNVGGSQWAGTMNQYCQTPATYFSNPTGEFGGVYESSDAIPVQPTDTQIAQEAVKGATYFGVDVKEATVVVATASHHSTSGFGSQYCGWHDATPYAGGQLSYENLPYQADQPQGCDGMAGASVVGGHEYAESVTDPVPPTGWSDPDGEIGDKCAWIDLQNISLNGVTLMMQPLWSDLNHGCVQ